MKYVTLSTNSETGEVRVVEVVEASIASGFFFAPREDIEVGDILTDYEQMVTGLIPWDESLVPVQPDPPSELSEEPITEEPGQGTADQTSDSSVLPDTVEPVEN